jgi:hypothetical protein
MGTNVLEGPATLKMEADGVSKTVASITELNDATSMNTIDFTILPWRSTSRNYIEFRRQAYILE